MSATEIRSLPVQDLYSKWGISYDQGRVNNLQGLDDAELGHSLQNSSVKSISLLVRCHTSSAGPLRVVDFGCGMGRNVLKLMAMLPGADIIGLDATPALLKVAEFAVAGH